MKSETRSAEGQMDSSSSSSSSCCKRKAVDSLISDSREKTARLELNSQDVLSVKDVCDLIHYITLRRSHSVRKPSWFGVGDERVSRVNVMVLDGLTQSHFYRYFSLFRHLRDKYSARWTLAPSSGDLLTSDLLSAAVTVCDRAAETRAALPAALRWHPVIRRFGLNAAGLSNFLLTQQEMIKQKYPVKGGWGCEEFVCTVSDGHVTDSSPLFGLDCEMCLTCVGLEVTRVALVDSSGCCVLDELVKPPNPIIDYCTRFSGITRAILAPVSTRLADVQSRLLQLLPPDAVLVGHSLDGDLRALYLVHPHVIDTSLLYRQEFGRRFKLKHLAQVVLKREIQSEVRIGHDPGEDALAALHLAQYFIRKGPREVVEDHLEDLWDLEFTEDDDSDHAISSNRRSSPLRFGHALSRSGQSALFLGGSVEMSGSLSNQQCRRHQCSSDREVVCVYRRVVQSYTLSVLQFSSFRNTLNQTAAMGPHLKQVCERLRQMCVLYVGPLPSDATETLVHRLLKHCGRLRTIRLLHYTHEVHSEVVFEHLEGAQLALEHLNGLQINDCIIKARRPVHELCLDLDERLSERQNDPLNAHVIYVSNLSSKPHRHEDQLQSFRQFGPIQRVTSAAEHAGKRGRHAFIRFECADSAQAAVGVAPQIRNRKLSVCHALTPPHMTSWTRPVTTEPSPDTPEQGEECDERLLERQMKKLDARVGKVFRALEENCLSVVILPGHRSDGVDHPGLCFIHIKQSN
ncbi:RNA exonuclease 5 [Sinocyclocheilus anshuiensis]|uniref:RRM domain-containing protein n=1 Tax=Sinocyclocheilus anshuiensis TaxID=1608454 RepID=A0A671SUX7_9TELE|nr:PREDICTED: putative RNA exonuclease NEF-sp [Sinocyclocheilus anshuiensis]